MDVLFAVIGVIRQERPGPVKLLGEHDARQGVRQGQARQRQGRFGACQDLRRQAIGAAVHLTSSLTGAGIAAAWGLACYRTMTDLEATVLVHAPGDDTLAVRIYTLQHDGQAEHVAALALILVALTLLASLSMCLLWRAGSDA